MIVRTDTGASVQPLGFSLLSSSVTPVAMVGSVRYLGKISVENQAFTRDDADAIRLSEDWNRTRDVIVSALLPSQASGQDISAVPVSADLHGILMSSKVEAHGNRVVVTAIVPPGLLKTLLATGQPAAAAQPNIPSH